MLNPPHVAKICLEMTKNIKIPVTVKCRLGADDNDSFPELCNFIKIVSEGAGVKKFIIHARKAYLSGLNPKENRNIPPLKHEWVFKL